MRRVFFHLAGIVPLVIAFAVIVVGLSNVTRLQDNFTTSPRVPGVELISPENTAALAENPIVFRCAVTQPLSKKSITGVNENSFKYANLYGNWSGQWQIEETKTLPRDGVVDFEMNLPRGTYEWNCAAGNGLGTEIFAPDNYTFSVNDLEPRQLIYEISEDLPSGIETNGQTWQEAGDENDFNERKLGRELSNYYDGAFVFELEDVNRGDYFSFARLILTSLGNVSSSGVNLTIAGISLDEAPMFDDANRPSQYPLTETKIRWEINEEWAFPEIYPPLNKYYFDYYSPNIAPVINEIINRPDWNETQKTIVIIVENSNENANENNYERIVFNTARTKLELGETPLDAIQNREFITAVTEKSALLSVVFKDNVDFFVEYGSESEEYDKRTEILYNQPAYEAIETNLEGLKESSEVYYRVNVRSNGSDSEVFYSFPEKHFTTRKKVGEEFRFIHLTDTHIFVPLIKNETDKLGAIETTFAHLESEAGAADFLIDTGDTAMTHSVEVSSAASQKGADFRYTTIRNYFERFALPVYYALGNHDAELGFEVPSSKHTFKLANLSLNARLKYWPNPTNETYLQGGGPYENYYAFEWGDALFVILDSYRYTETKPLVGDDWEIGEEQLNWLNRTLSESDKKWKFLFAHHIFGGADLFWSGYNYGDGGGNYSQTGDQKIINDLLEEYNAQIYFYGHIHLFTHDWNNWSSAGRIKSVNYVGTSSVGANPSQREDRLVLYDNEIQERGYTIVDVSPQEVTFAFVNHSDGETLYEYSLQNAAPTIILNSPQGNVNAEEEIEFEFYYEDEDYDIGKVCDLYIDNKLKNSMRKVRSGTTNIFLVEGLDVGEHIWQVKCTDGALVGESEIINFRAILTEIPMNKN